MIDAAQLVTYGCSGVVDTNRQTVYQSLLRPRLLLLRRAPRAREGDPSERQYLLGARVKHEDVSETLANKTQQREKTALVKSVECSKAFLP